MFQPKERTDQASGSKPKAIQNFGKDFSERFERAAKKLEQVIKEHEEKSGGDKQLSPVAEEEEENEFDEEAWAKESPENFSSDSDDIDVDGPGNKSPVI